MKYKNKGKTILLGSSPPIQKIKQPST